MPLPAVPVSVVQWAKPPLIGQSACWADGLRALTGLGSTPGLEGSFSACLVERNLARVVCLSDVVHTSLAASEIHGFARN